MPERAQGPKADGTGAGDRRSGVRETDPAGFNEPLQTATGPYGPREDYPYENIRLPRAPTSYRFEKDRK